MESQGKPIYRLFVRYTLKRMFARFLVRLLTRNIVLQDAWDRTYSCSGPEKPKDFNGNPEQSKMLKAKVNKSKKSLGTKLKLVLVTEASCLNNKT